MVGRRIAMVSLHTSPVEPLGSADAGGMNVVELHLARALVPLGYSVELITRRTDPSQPEVVALGDGVLLRHLTAGPVSALPKSEIDAHIPQFAAGLAGLGDYDLYHCQHWMSGIAALELARERGSPHVVTFHSLCADESADLSEGEPPESPARAPGERLLARSSDHIICVSAAEASTVVNRCGAAPERVSIVAPGVDLAGFHPGRVAGGRPYLAFAARLQPLKAPDLAIEALARIDPAIRPRLMIAGAVSLDFAGYAAHLRDLVARLGLDSDVVFLGPQTHEELAGLFRGAVAVVVPSFSETFGLVALEAAASGTPVVAAASGGLPEAVVQGRTGCLVDSRDPADWARVITGLLTDPVAVARMGALARIHARRFTWAAMARGVAEVYETLMRASALRLAGVGPDALGPAGVGQDALGPAGIGPADEDRASGRGTDPA